jgi:hypothetical protein
MVETNKKQTGRLSFFCQMVAQFSWTFSKHTPKTKEDALYGKKQHSSIN